MSSIPPNVIGSAIQASLAQRQAGESKEVDEVRASQANDKQVARNQEMDSTVETTDADTRVHSEGGGLGSQGRQYAEEGEATEQEEQAQPDSGITVDEDGQPHVDLEA